MKKAILLFLSILILVPTIGSFTVYALFKFNQDEISKTLCVQRKLAINTCNGRCELSKSLKKYDDNDNKMEQNMKEKADFVFLFNALSAELKVNPCFSISQTNFSLTVKKTQSYTVSTFRPPSFFI